MSHTSGSAQLEALRKAIENLALEAALRDLSSPELIQPLAPLLAEIGRHAKSAGLSSVAEIAAITPRSEVQVREAVAYLQQLVEQAPLPSPDPPAPPPSAPPPPSAALNQDPELVADFIMESREHLSALEAQLLTLEQNPRNTEAINTIFRGFHTIKGLAGFLDFQAIQRFAHEVETLLDLARNAKVAVDSTLVDIILQSADHMNHCLLGVESGLEPASDVRPLMVRIRQMIDSVTEAPPGLAQLAAAVADSASTAAQDSAPAPAVAPPPTRAAELAPASSAPVPAAPSIPTPASAVSTPAVPTPAAPPAPPAQSTSEAAGGPRSVKVDTSKLDYLVDMVGELVIAQSLIQHDPEMGANHSPRLARNLSQLTRITSDVQRIAMAMRMLPVAQLFQRMSRLVRDLARKSNKQANLELSGEDTELDRNMVEELADPLMHMIRNAVDHGAEPPEARLAAGKGPIARIDLKAYHQGGFINIQISDDGRGLVREKILTKAQQRGLVSGGDHLSDSEVFNFIFEPGFSTAEKITDVSGRGVGMDVVRKQIMKLRGRIDISSRPGNGTTFNIKLPLTLAIIEGLVVGVGTQRYVVPISAVKEMFRPVREALSTVPAGGELVMVRGSLLPVLRLHSRFGVRPRSEDPVNGLLVVVDSVRRNFCILVDELIGKQEVVIKSLGETFKNVSGIAGGSILGDGRVGLILDVEALYGDPAHE